MAAKKIEIRTIGKPQLEAMVLLLERFNDGWGYTVQGLETGPLSLPWRTESAQAAEEKLKESYDPDVWELRFLE